MRKMFAAIIVGTLMALGIALPANAVNMWVYIKPTSALWIDDSSQSPELVAVGSIRILNASGRRVKVTPGRCVILKFAGGTSKSHCNYGDYSYWAYFGWSVRVDMYSNDN